MFRCTCAGSISNWWFQGFRGYEECPEGDLRSCHVYSKEKIIVDTYLDKFSEYQIKDLFSRGKSYDNSTEADTAVATSKGGLKTLEEEIDENGDRVDTYNHEKIKEIRGNFQTTKDINSKLQGEKSECQERPYIRAIKNYRQIIANDRQKQRDFNQSSHNQSTYDNNTLKNFTESYHTSGVAEPCIDKDADEFDIKDFNKKKLA